jgi:hypothetical protein
MTEDDRVSEVPRTSASEPRLSGQALRTTTTQDVIESHASALSELAAAISDPSLPHLSIEEEPGSAISDGGQALDVHEVVELQAYDERKWITEQIQVRVLAARYVHNLMVYLVPGTSATHRRLRWR